MANSPPRNRTDFTDAEQESFARYQREYSPEELAHLLVLADRKIESLEHKMSRMVFDDRELGWG